MLLQLVVLYTVPVEALTIASAVAALAMALLIKRALAFTYVSIGWNADRALLLLWLGPPMIAALISALFMPVFLARTLAGHLDSRLSDDRRRDCAQRRSAGPKDHRRRDLHHLAADGLSDGDAPGERTLGPGRFYLSLNVAAHDQLWLYPADSALPLDAVGRRIRGEARPIPEPFPTLGFKGPIRAGWPATVSLTPEQAATFAGDPAIKDVPVIWLVTRQSGIFDPRDDVPRALAQVRRPGPLQRWGFIGVQPFYRR